MRTILIFPPWTSPTYMPLGAAYLAAVAARDGLELDVFDANLELWNYLCDEQPQLRAMRDFARSPLSVFLDKKAYAANWGHLPEAKYRIDLLERQARQYLEHDALSDELLSMQVRQTLRIGRNTPEIIAFSAMYLDQLPFILAQAKYLVTRLNAGSRIVIGGAAMSGLSSPAELLDAAPFVDAVLTGEGEVPFEMLLRGRGFAEIPGCYYRENGTVTFSGKAIYRHDLAEIAPPDFRPFAAGTYFNPVPVMSILGGRGCKWRRCRFCSHNNSFGPHRRRTAFAIVGEMLERREHFGCRHFYFADQYVDPQFLDELSDAILAVGLQCSFQVMARTVDAYTPAVLEKASRAGCCWISWGMESGSQKLLDLMDKGTRADVSLQVMKNAAAAGISNLAMMIFGTPGSDAECLDETFSFLDRAWSSIDGMTASAFVLFDRTAFSRHPSKYGLQILGNNSILEIGGRKIHDLKLRFKRDTETEPYESPLAAREIEAWNRRKVWLPPLPFHGQLCCEHYLLYSEAKRSCDRPRKPRRVA